MLSFCASAYAEALWVPLGLIWPTFLRMGSLIAVDSRKLMTLFCVPAEPEIFSVATTVGHSPEIAEKKTVCEQGTNYALRSRSLRLPLDSRLSRMDFDCLRSSRARLNMVEPSSYHNSFESRKTYGGQEDNQIEY